MPVSPSLIEKVRQEAKKRKLMDWHDIPNPKHRQIVELYVNGYTLQGIANEMEYTSKNGFRIVARVLRRLRNAGYDIPRKVEFEGGTPTGVGPPPPMQR